MTDNFHWLLKNRQIDLKLNITELTIICKIWDVKRFFFFVFLSSTVGNLFIDMY